MKFTLKKSNQTITNEEKAILFVCAENTGRSQMAEGFFKKYAPSGFKAISARTIPVSQINPLAVQAMKEVEIDINNQKRNNRSNDYKFNKDY